MAVGYAQIEMSDPDAQIDSGAWAAYVEDSPLLRPVQEIVGKDPFNSGQPIAFRVPGSAELVVAGQSQGYFILSSGRIYVDGDETYMTPVAADAAKFLKAQLVSDDGNPIQAEPGSFERIIDQVQPPASQPSASLALLLVGLVLVILALALTYLWRANSQR